MTISGFTMVKNADKLFIIAFALFSFLLFSCNNENRIEESIESINTDTVNPRNSEKIFKDWIKDTLVYMRSWEEEKETDVVKKEVLLSNDSLSLKKNVYYTVTVNEKTKLSGDVLNMVETLKEYDELPKNSFNLSFIYYIFYSPSSVERFRYSFICEYKDIVIEEHDKKSEFGYIRGRLSHKVVIEKNINGKQEEIITDFIWDGDSIVKKRIYN